MKTNNNIVSPCYVSVKTNSPEGTGFYLPFLVAVLLVFFVPLNVMAARERFVLDFDDSIIRGYRGEAATIYLKKSLRHQYPWVDLSDKELRKVILVAKSKKGRGVAMLRVGERATDMHKIKGSSRDFKNYRRYTFDRAHFSNPSPGSRGPWQMDLRGNFVVRKIVLEMDDRPKHREHKRRHNYKN